MNARAEGVAMTQTCQPRSWASPTSLPTSRAAGVAQVMDVEHSARLLLLVAHTATPTARASWVRAEDGLIPRG